MRKILFVGDPHVQPSNLADSEKLMECVESICKEDPSIDEVCILGDLFHTKELIRGNVMIFWERWLRRLALTVHVKALVGNHDQFALGNEKDHSLKSFCSIENVKIIEEPTLEKKIGYVPYIHDNACFVTKANSLSANGAKTIICHATFVGNKYENGFYAEGGVDPSLMESRLLISGHIHVRGRFSNVINPGTPMWHTASDANQQKGLTLMSISDDGEVVSEQFFDTSTVVTPIRSIVVKEGEEVPEIGSGKVFVVLEGSSAWIKEKAKEIKGKANIRGKPTDTKTRKEVKGNFLSFKDYFDSFKLSGSVHKDHIISYLKELDVYGQT